MRHHVSAFLAVLPIVAATDGVVAHHSIAMFDKAHPIELVGVVQEIRFTSPHTFILLEVKARDGKSIIWNLEGNSPNSLTWDGWSSRSLRPGDELRLTIEPLRSGAPGGTWTPSNTKYKDGTAIPVTH